jgi:colanic acid/amylovoran biosynthesis glycosyltransferase
MKIGYLIPEWPGQSHVWAWREISHLRESGLNVTILSTRQPKQLGKHSFAIKAQAETSYLWPLSMTKVIQSLMWALLRSPQGFLSCIQLGFTLPIDQKPSWKSVLPLMIPACRLAHQMQEMEIEHLHTPIPGNSAILMMMVKRLVNIPFSLTVVAPFGDWGGAMQEKFEDAAFVTVVAQWMMEQMQKDFTSIPGNRYCITRHGVDIQKWTPDSTQKLAASEPKQIFSIGRLAHSKGFDVLLKSLVTVKSQGIDFQLKIAGEGPERSRLEALICDLGLGSNVVLLGSVSEDECLAVMQASDLFVSASRSEGFSVARQEAMAVEVATIGTDIEGADELITDRVNGLLVPPEDADVLADAISRVLSDEQFRTQLARAGRQTMLDKFDSRLGAAILHNLIVQSVYDQELVTQRKGNLPKSSNLLPSG